MPLTAGERLGPYEISALIGKGGMGEVYKARDTRLGRDVAIKVSAQQFSERFEREARAIAALNHPNICTLYDVGPNYLVMEYIEGESPKGPLPLDEALRICRQVAEALREAHQKNITHRDLKPANIKIKPDGMVKVLDFGLAKVGPTSTSDKDATVTLGATQAGAILGTPAYMSPEQARGQEIDKRADIFSFGILLHELLTGERTFTGDTISDVLASVLKTDPDLSQVPIQVRRLLKRCLEKDPKKRLQDIGDVWDLLDEGVTQVPPQTKARPPWAAWIVAGTAITALAMLAFFHFREAPPPRQVFDFAIIGPAKTAPDRIALSPDGRYLAMVAAGTGAPQIWIRSFDSEALRVLPGTEGAAYPFWSPDSRTIGFFATGKLKKVAVTGGPAQSLCDAASASGGSWNSEGVIIFGRAGAGIMRVPMAGGEPVPVTESATPAGHRFPFFLPDGHRFLYLAQTDKEPGVLLGSLDVKPDAQQAKRILADLSNPQYLPPFAGNPHGHLLFVRENTLMAQPLNPQSLDSAGDVFPVAEQIARTSTNGFFNFSISQTGILAHHGSGGNLRQHAWFDRSGKQTAKIGEPQDTLGRLALSPDEKRLITERGSGTSIDLWITELDRGTESRFTFDPGTDLNPIWSPDGLAAAFSSARGKSSNVPSLYRKTADGTGQDELVLEAASPFFPSDWTRDGKYIIARSGSNPMTKFDLIAIPITGDKKPIPLLTSEFDEVMGTVSPDGRWLAYASNESGTYEVYVRPFAPGKPSAGKWQISLGDGRDPHWRGDSRELFYVTQTRKMMAVDVRVTGDSFSRGAPQELFNMPYPTAGNTLSRYVVTKDGKRFIMAADPEAAVEASPIHVTVNWLAKSKQ